MLNAPARTSALCRARTAGPDALPLWQNEQGLCLQNRTEAASQHSNDISAVKSTVASLTKGMYQELDYLNQCLNQCFQTSR